MGGRGLMSGGKTLPEKSAAGWNRRDDGKIFGELRLPSAEPPNPLRGMDLGGRPSRGTVHPGWPGSLR